MGQEGGGTEPRSFGGQVILTAWSSRMNDSFLLAARPARICPWLRCSLSPFPSGDSFILQVRLCFIFLKLCLGPGWREMHVSIAGFVYLLFTLPGGFCRGICLACSLTSSRSQLQQDLLREAFSDRSKWVFKQNIGFLINLISGNENPRFYYGKLL